ncbi:hypothetical protein F4V43_03410 [Paenibacillus spiritus]|uniref:Arsenite S-adenosylmethyltransferase n=1 Tax=Paenibacillus spiritus TaxID=2496557 RepID=A0A5J5GIV3_9BACL|nr:MULTISPECIES: hypothetical protein [Paenibacillus]KAA9007552.1 hypothetical protein F4V43_03410 [Paenibacillus spiritus]
MNETHPDQIRRTVRSRYQPIAAAAIQASGPAKNVGSCCGAPTDFNEISARLGYASDELQAVPEGANLGLGCGNPQAIAGLQPGECVLDLGRAIGRFSQRLGTGKKH